MKPFSAFELAPCRALALRLLGFGQAGAPQYAAR